MGFGTTQLNLIIIAFPVYFLPAIIGRRKNNSRSIFRLNLLLGWTLIGWVIALRRALSKEVLPVYLKRTPSAPQLKSTADELAKLAKLHSDGVLTQKEFETEKRRLLS